MKTLREYKQLADTNNYKIKMYKINEEFKIYDFVNVTEDLDTIVSMVAFITEGDPEQIMFAGKTMSIEEAKIVLCIQVEDMKYIQVMYHIEDGKFETIKTAPIRKRNTPPDIEFTGKLEEHYTEEMIFQDSLVNGDLEKIKEMQEFILKHKDDLL